MDYGHKHLKKKILASKKIDLGVNVGIFTSGKKMSVFNPPKSSPSGHFVKTC
jgi:hypothetical protein